MTIPQSTTTDGKEWCSTPTQVDPLTTGGITGVWLNPACEEVEWTWSADGRRIEGYVVRPKDGKPGVVGRRQG